jgi:hypothetical protein
MPCDADVRGCVCCDEYGTHRNGFNLQRELCKRLLNHSKTFVLLHQSKIPSMQSNDKVSESP